MVEGILGEWRADLLNCPENKNYIKLLNGGESSDSKTTHFTTVISKEADDKYITKTFLEGKEEPVLSQQCYIGQKVKQYQPGFGEVEFEYSIEGNSIVSKGNLDGKVMRSVKFYVDGDCLVAESITGDTKSILFRADRA